MFVEVPNGGLSSKRVIATVGVGRGRWFWWEAQKEGKMQYPTGEIGKEMKF